MFFKSLRETNPEWEPHLLLAGGDERTARRDRVVDGVRIHSPYEVLGAERYRELMFSYDSEGLASVLRPFWLEHVLASFAQAWLFDPKTLMVGPLGPVVAALGDFSVALVPRLRDAPPPERETELAEGVYSQRYIGVSSLPDAFAFLEWWQRGRGMPRRLDPAPALFDGAVILRDRRFIADLEWIDEAPQDAVGFGFGGYDPPSLLEARARTRARSWGPRWLRTLITHYGSLVANSGHEFYRDEPYAGDRFSNGAVVDERVRRLHRAARDAGLHFDDPWYTSAHPSLYEWVNSAADNAEASARPLTRYLELFHASRPDLVAAFPDPGARDRETFYRWLDSELNHGIDPHYVRPNAVAPIDTSLPGVNVAGYFRSELGVGEAGRGHARVLQSMGARTALIDVSAGSANRQSDRSFADFSDGNPYPINLICVNADQMGWFAQQVGSEFFAGKYCIGSWWWELPVFPDAWRSALPYVHEIWAGSHFIVDTLARIAPVPVVRVPPVVDASRRSPVGKDHFGLPQDAFSFLYIFDYLSIFERKNPVAAVHAFQQAFKGNRMVRLVLKSINAERDPASADVLRAFAAADPRILLIETYMSAEEKNALIGACDAYLSLHRSEGFGLTIAEAMALGKPVIATGWSGNMDFMTAFNSFPVEYELVTLERDEGPYRAGQRWAAPNEGHAAFLMRRVLADDNMRVRAAALGRAEIRTRFSRYSVARIVHDRLAVIAGVLREGRS